MYGSLVPDVLVCSSKRVYEFLKFTLAYAQTQKDFYIIRKLVEIPNWFLSALFIILDDTLLGIESSVAPGTSVGRQVKSLRQDHLLTCTDLAVLITSIFVTVGVELFKDQDPEKFSCFTRAFHTMFTLLAYAQWTDSLPALDEDGNMNFDVIVFTCKPCAVRLDPSTHPRQYN